MIMYISCVWRRPNVCVSKSLNFQLLRFNCPFHIFHGVEYWKLFKYYKILKSSNTTVWEEIYKFRQGGHEIRTVVYWRPFHQK